MPDHCGSNGTQQIKHTPAARDCSATSDNLCVPIGPTTGTATLWPGEHTSALDQLDINPHHGVMSWAKDDYKAKYRLWVSHPPLFSPPVPLNLPRFGCKRFSSYEELNAWKRQYRLEIARAGGVQWKR